MIVSSTRCRPRPAAHFGLILALGVAAACGGAAQTAQPVAGAGGPQQSGNGIASSATAAPSSAVPAPSAAATGATAAAVATSFGNNRPIVASQLMTKLTDAGLDVKNLPALDKMSQTQLQKVMNTFTKSLGWKCNDCHEKSGFAAAHPMKNVARRMWDEYVRGISFEGGALYCDSCHQGKGEFLDKSDKKVLAAWMDAEYTKRMKRHGQAQACATCHGEPFNGDIISEWRKK
jgi:hypothetical protein